MIYSIGSIKDARSKSIPIIDKEDNHEISSFFFESLNIILTETSTFQTCLIETYSDNIIQEGFTIDLFKKALSKIDFKKIFKKIIEMFLNALDKLGKEFTAMLLNLFNQKDVIKHYKKELENIEIVIRYSEERYRYSNLGLNTSYTNLKSELEKEFSSTVLDLTKLGKFKEKDIISEIERMKSDINMTEEYYDTLRGKIVSSRNPVEKSDFAKELFKYFRFGGFQIAAGEVTPKEIREILDNYMNYSKSIKLVKKDQSDMKSYAKKLESDINNIKLEDYIKENISPEIQKLFLAVLQNKTIRVKEICNLFLQLFAAKLDAIKESYVTDAKILITACKAIVKED